MTLSSSLIRYLAGTVAMALLAVLTINGLHMIVTELTKNKLFDRYLDLPNDNVSHKTNLIVIIIVIIINTIVYFL
jgi:NADH:ubiquinone oxidoreductase subunit 5 (subunit L)/multisubunit Na+/H+ antiporter MnhA subunit